MRRIPRPAESETSANRSAVAEEGRDLEIRVRALARRLFVLAAAHRGSGLRGLDPSPAPLGTEGTGWDVAWAAVFLASDEARWITGVALPVDAGFLVMSPTTNARLAQQKV